MAIILDIGQNVTKLGIKSVCLRLEKVMLSLRPPSSGETTLGVHPPGEKQLLVSMRTPVLFSFQHNHIYFLMYPCLLIAAIGDDLGARFIVASCQSFVFCSIVRAKKNFNK